MTAVASTVVTGFWLAALPTGRSWWLGALILGSVVVPVVAVLYGDEDLRREWWDEWVGNGSDANERERQRTDPRAERDALETLRDRYARGELSDERFERKLEKLLETVEDRQLERERERAR